MKVHFEHRVHPEGSNQAPVAQKKGNVRHCGELNEVLNMQG